MVASARPPAGVTARPSASRPTGRSIRVVPICTEDRHQDRQRNVDRKAELERQKAIAVKVADLQRRIRARLDDVDVVVLILAVHDTWGLPELVAGEGDPDRSQLRDLAAERLARVADPTNAWGDNRGPKEQALEALLAMLPPVEASA